jgi:hypothetical protein
VNERRRQPGENRKVALLAKTLDVPVGALGLVAGAAALCRKGLLPVVVKAHFGFVTTGS